MAMKESLWITYDEKQHPVELTFVDGSKDYAFI